ncbi:MAG: hypothetical protein C5B50_23270 [Verrucomicrobia bacterium]|nr:MAG: hypothetical protein C5B50_23270 [Verrucomicrobiota bacterium]
MNKFQRSWLLLKSSLSVIGRNKELLIFPIVIFVCTIAMVSFFVAPALLRPTGYSYLSAQHWQAISHSLFRESAGPSGRAGFTPGAVVYFAFIYFVAMFIATFFNVAFYNEILAALTGQPVSVARGLRFAFTKLGSILMWTLFAGLVGLIIKTIEERFALVGRIIGRLLGIAWSIAAVFAIPVIVREEKNANPFSVLQKSASAIKRTWGEALIGYVGLSFANTAIFLASVLVLGGFAVLCGALNNYWLLIPVGLVWLVAIFCWSYLIGVASNVYRGALFLYAAEGTVPEPYSQELLDMAWKVKRS